MSCPFWSILQLYLSGNTILILGKHLRGRLGNRAFSKVAFGPSSETQGQIVGAKESLRDRSLLRPGRGRGEGSKKCGV